MAAFVFWGVVNGCSKPPSPDILLITLDTFRVDALGVCGNAVIDTPVLDAFARKGVLFTTVAPPMPLTAPSHASLLTGLYPRTHGLESNVEFLDEKFVTLAEILKEAGYRTLAVVSGFPLARNLSHLDQGFEEYREVILDEPTSAKVTAEVLAWLKKRDKRPVFVWAHYYDPHVPYEPPPPFSEREYGGDLPPTLALKDDFQLHVPEEQLHRSRPYWEFTPEEHLNMRSRYFGEAASTDQAIGVLLRQWPRSGRGALKVIITADHGESLGEHGVYYEHDACLFDQVVTVPLLMQGFGEIPGSVIPQQMRLIDLLPTLLEEVDIAAPTLLPGRSLLNELRDPASARDRLAILQTGSSPDAAVGESSAPPSQPPRRNLNLPQFLQAPGSGPPPQLASKAPVFIDFATLESRRILRYGFRNGSFKYIATADGGKEIFDLESDPAETRNLEQGFPQEGDPFAQAIEEWRRLFPPPPKQAARALDPATVEKLRALGYVH